MTAYSAPAFDESENIVFGHDPEIGLRAIIAILNANLGTAVGGCHMWPYPNKAAAIEDALSEVFQRPDTEGTDKNVVPDHIAE